VNLAFSPVGIATRPPLVEGRRLRDPRRGVPSASGSMQLGDPVEDAEAAAMRTAGLGGPWMLPAPWTPRTRPQRLGNRYAVSTSAHRRHFWWTKDGV
jgi:hypothetical protein